MFKKYELRYYNFRLLLLVLATSVYGVILINSADSSYTLRQILGIIIGSAVLILASFFDYHRLLKLYWILYLVLTALLVLTLMFGRVSHGAKRWLVFGPFSLQAAEIGKVILILFTVRMLSIYREKINSWSFLFLLWLILLVPLALTLREPDLSQTILTAMVLFTVIFTAGVSYKKMGLFFLIVIPLAAGLLFYIQRPDQKLLADYQRTRIMAYIDPENYDDNVYQQKYSETAIATGGLTGKGLNNEDPSSLLNAGYIPEAHTDFIFAAAGEELGFVGSMSIILLLAAITAECLYVGYRARDMSGRLICTGVACYIGYQSFINIGVVTGILPNTGLTLPFFSYGMSSIVTLFLAVGIVLNVSLQRNMEKDDEINIEHFRGFSYYHRREDTNRRGGLA